MSFQPSNSKQSFLPTSIILPDIEDGTEHNLILTDYLKKIIAALNDKDIGQYVTQEILTGQKFFTPNNNNVFRSSFRKVINFGTLPNTGSTSVAHNITVNASTIFTRIYGVATDPIAFSYLPLPYASTIGDNIEVEVDSTNIIISTASDRSSYTTCYIIAEFLKS
jgi:hypothetical protein